MGSNTHAKQDGPSASANSCVSCRLSSASCDGKQPCERCIRLNQAGGCFRVPPQPRGRPRTRRRPGESSEPTTMVNIRPANSSAPGSSPLIPPPLTAMAAPLMNVMPQIVTPWFMQLPLPLFGSPSAQLPPPLPQGQPIAPAAFHHSPSVASPSISLQSGTARLSPIPFHQPYPNSLPAMETNPRSGRSSPLVTISRAEGQNDDNLSEKKRSGSDESETATTNQPRPAKRQKPDEEKVRTPDSSSQSPLQLTPPSASSPSTSPSQAISVKAPNGELVRHCNFSTETLLHFPFLHQYNLSGMRFVGENLDKPLLVISLGLTKKTNIMFANPAFCDLLGYSLAELLDIQPWLLEWNIKVRVLVVLTKAGEKMGVSPIERARIEFVHKDGSRLKVDARVQWFYGPDGMIRCAVGCIDRVTGVQLPPWTMQELADSLPLHDRTQRVVRYREHLRLNESLEWKQVEAAYAHLMPTTQQTNGTVHTTSPS